MEEEGVGAEMQRGGKGEGLEGEKEGKLPFQLRCKINKLIN